MPRACRVAGRCRFPFLNTGRGRVQGGVWGIRGGGFSEQTFFDRERACVDLFEGPAPQCGLSRSTRGRSRSGRRVRPERIAKPSESPCRARSSRRKSGHSGRRRRACRRARQSTTIFLHDFTSRPCCASQECRRAPCARFKATSLLRNVVGDGNVRASARQRSRRGNFRAPRLASPSAYDRTHAP